MKEIHVLSIFCITLPVRVYDLNSCTYKNFSDGLLMEQGKDKTAEERRIAICIFDDMAEHCREAALK